MASKGGLVAVGGVALSLLALLAFSGTAKASPKPKPIPEDIYSKEACAAYETERASVLKYRNAAQQNLSAINSAMQAAADAGDEAQLAYLASQQYQLKGAIANANAELNKFDALIAKCP